MSQTEYEALSKAYKDLSHRYVLECAKTKTLNERISILEGRRTDREEDLKKDNANLLKKLKGCDCGKHKLK
jgi:hypothetical protein